MIDRDLAEMYGVETKVLNQAVKRNLKRFPADFMFQMTNEELTNWRSQIVTSNLLKAKMGLRKLPNVYRAGCRDAVECIKKRNSH